jgi:hypothetical protein
LLFTSLTGHGRRSGRSGSDDVFVNVFHVLHQGLVAKEKLVTQGTTCRVGSANQGRVLFRTTSMTRNEWKLQLLHDNDKQTTNLSSS